MLPAHLVPGYFAAAHAQGHWAASWSRAQRALLWAVAVGSAVAPDADVIINLLFRGFIGHTNLWTHSVFVYLPLALAWWLLGRLRRWPYLRAALGLAAFGGLSHLLLDVVAHGTPLFYPFSWVMVGVPPARVVAGGLWAYVTDPIFLLEPLLLGAMLGHALLAYRPPLRWRWWAVGALVVGVVGFVAVFLALLPQLQHWAAAKMGW